MGDEMPVNALWVPLVLGTAALTYVLIHRSNRAWRRPAVDALIVQLGMPVDDHIISLLDKRVRNTAFLSCLAAFVALLVIGGLVLLNGGFPEGLASTALSLAFVAAAALGCAAAGIAQFAPQGPGAVRIARTRTPELRDYVNPGWMWASGGVCAIAVLCTLATFLGADPHPRLLGLPLLAVVVSTCVAVCAQCAAVVLSRRLLNVPQPAQNELELRWDDALRGMALRSLWIASLTLAWAAALLAVLWLLAPSPSASMWFGFIAIVPIVLFSLRPSRRTEWHLWPDAATTASADQVALGAP